MRCSYTPPKRRPARVRALPDAAVAVSVCGLAVWLFTFLKKKKLNLKTKQN
jgi:hypothetical protein